MLRQIVTPAGPSLTLQLPGEMGGKTIEVIAFELRDTVPGSSTDAEIASRLKKIQELTKNSRTDLSKFKFDRDEANNYDE